MEQVTRERPATVCRPFPPLTLYGFVVVRYHRVEETFRPDMTTFAHTEEGALELASEAHERWPQIAEASPIDCVIPVSMNEL